MPTKDELLDQVLAPAGNPKDQALNDIMAPAVPPISPEVADMELGNQTQIVNDILGLDETPINVNEVATHKQGIPREGPIPTTSLEAARAAGRDGLSIVLSENMWEEVDGLSGLLWVDFLKRSKLFNRITPELFEKGHAALRYNAIRYMSDMADEEKDAVIRTAAGNLLGKAKDAIRGRLQELGTGELIQTARGIEERFDPEVEQLQQTFAKLQSYESRVAEPDFMSAFRFLLSDAVADGKEDPDSIQELERRGVLRQLDSMFSPAERTTKIADKMGIEPPTGNGVFLKEDAKAKIRPLRLQTDMEETLREALSAANEPNAVNRVTRAAARGSLKQARLARMGLSEEAIETGGLMASLFVTHPTLMQEVQKEAEAVEALQSSGTAPVHTAEAEHELQAQRGIRGVVLEMGRQEAAEVAAFDPEAPVPETPGVERIRRAGARTMGQVGQLFQSLLEVTDRNLNIFRDTFTASNRPGDAPGEGTMTFDARGVRMETQLDRIFLPRADREAIKVGIAAGAVDPLTVSRYTHNGETGIGALFLGALESLAGLDGASGKVAAEALQGLAGTNINPIVARRLLADARRTVVDTSLGVEESRAEVEARFSAAADEMKKGNFFSGLSLSMTALVQKTLGTDFREMAAFFIEKPTAIPVFGALGMIGGVATKPMVRGAQSSFHRAAASMTLGSRFRRALRDVLAFEPDAAGRLKDFFRDTGKKFFSENQLRSLEATLTTLSQEAQVGASDMARLTQGGHDRFWARRYRSLRELDRTLRRSKKPLEVSDLMDPGVLPADILETIKNPTRVSLLGEFVNDIGRRVGLGRAKLYPHLRKRFDNLARNVNAMLDSGANLDEISSMPFPMVGVEGGLRKVGNRVLARIPAAARFFGIDDIEKSSLMVQTAKFVTDILPTARALQILNDVVRTKQLGFLKMVQNKTEGLAKDALGVMQSKRTLGMDTALDRRQVRNVLGQRRRVKDLQREVDLRDWRNDVKLSQNERLRNQLTLSDLATWLHQDQGGMLPLWTRAARTAQGKVETIETFANRMKALLEGERLRDEGLIPQPQRAKLTKQLDRQKKDLMRAFLDREAPGKTVQTDVATGDAVAFHQAEILRAERAAVRAAADQGDAAARRKVAGNPEIYDPENDFGFEVLDVEAPLKQLRRNAATMTAAETEALYPIAGGTDYGDLSSYLAAGRNAELAVRNNLWAHEIRTQRYLRVLSDLPDETRAAYNVALSDLANGKASTMKEWLAAHPAVKAKLGVANDFENIAAVWTDLEDVRNTLLAEAVELGMPEVPRAAFEKWVRPYAPQLYSAHESHQFWSNWVRQQLPKRATVTQRVAAEELAEFQFQRDLTQWRVQVRQQGSTWIDKKFDTEEAARAWLGERVGVRGDKFKKLKKIGFRGKTDLGDDFLLAAPLGQQAAKDLGMLETGVALGKRVADLARNVALWRYLKIFDRPGWSLTPDEFATKLKSRQGRKQMRNYMQLNSSRVWGPLQGQHVHKRIVRAVANFLETQTRNEQLAAELKKVFINSLDSKAMYWTGRMLSLNFPLADKVRQLIATNLIQRSSSTNIGNFFWDQQRALRSAAGREALTSTLGKEAATEAFEDMFGVKGWTEGVFGVTTRGDDALRRAAKSGPGRRFLDPDFIPGTNRNARLIEAVEDGMYGDTLIGSPMEGRLRTDMIDALYGKPDPRAARVLARFGVKPDTPVLGKLGQALGAFDPDPQIAKLRRRLREIEEIPDDRLAGMSAKAQARLQNERIGIEETISRAESPGVSVLNGIQWALGLKTKFGKFDELSTFTNQFYTRVNNYNRLRGYYYLRKMGLSRERARERIHKFMQDYAAIPSWVKGLRKSSLANPIFSFPFEYARIQKNLLMESPEFLLAEMSVAPAISAVSMMSAGVSPQELWAMHARNGEFDAFMNMIGTLHVPTPDGGIATIQTPFMQPHLIFQKPWGFLGSLVESAERSQSPAKYLGGPALRLFGQFFGRSPQIDIAGTLLTGKDPVTQRVVDGGLTGRITSALRNAGRLFVPPWVPLFGSAGEFAMATIKMPPAARDGRITEAHERILQGMFGLRVRGGLISQIADNIGAGKVLDYGTKLFLETARVGEEIRPIRLLEPVVGRALTVGPKITIPAALPRAQGFTDRHILTSLYYASAKYDLTSGVPLSGGEDSNTLQDLRLAEFFDKHAAGSDDTKLKAVSDRIRKDALQRIEEEVRGKLEIVKASEAAKEGLVKKEQLGQIRRAMDLVDLGSAFAKSGARRQTRVLIMGSALGLDEKELGALTLRARFAHENDFKTVRKWTDSAGLKLAIDDLSRYLKDTPAHATARGPLTLLLLDMQDALPEATLREMNELFNRPKRLQQFLLWKEAVAPEQPEEP